MRGLKKSKKKIVNGTCPICEQSGEQKVVKVKNTGIKFRCMNPRCKELYFIKFDKKEKKVEENKGELPPALEKVESNSEDMNDMGRA